MTGKLPQKTFVKLFKSIFILSLFCDANVANVVDIDNVTATKTGVDILCKDGQTFGHGVLREVSSNTFILVCDSDFELSSKNHDEVKCRDGFVVVKESPKCRETSFSPTFRKIRSTHDEREMRSVDGNEGRSVKRRRHNQNDDSVRRSNRRKHQRRRKQHQNNNNNNNKHVFQSDEGAASVPGEAVQWRSYGNDVVGKVIFYYYFLGKNLSIIFSNHNHNIS
jgi:hypothetical protein